MKKFLFLLVVLLVLTGCSHKPNKDNMPNSRDLLYTLERLEMPPQDVELWRQYLLGVDSVGSHFKGGDTLSIGSLEALTGSFQASLPHEAASLRFSSQSINDDTLTTPTAAAITNGATWTFGMNLDIGNSKILFSGVPGESVVAAFSWWQWQDSADPDGHRYIKLNTTGGGATQDLRPATNHASLNTYNFAFNVRKMAAGESDFNIQVRQDSGGAINGDGLLVVVRLR